MPAHRRAMRLLFYGMAAAVLFVFGIGHCAGQTIKFIPQPRPSKWVQVYDVLFCSPDDSTEPTTANLAVITKYAPPELPILNPYSRSYEQGRTNRHILLRAGDTVHDVSNGFIVLVATNAIDYNGTAWTKAAALYSFLWGKTRNPIDQQLNKALSEQPFWGDFEVQIAPGGACQRMAAAALRPREKSAKKALESQSIEVRIRREPPLSMFAPAWRVDAIDWQDAAARALAPFAPAACVVRPSSVVNEGCGGWYG